MSVDVLWLAVGVGAALFAGFVGGIWVGGNHVRTYILDEIAEAGLMSTRGVRYRVDRIGRKPKDEK